MFQYSLIIKYIGKVVVNCKPLTYCSKKTRFQMSSKYSYSNGVPINQVVHKLGSTYIICSNIDILLFQYLAGCSIFVMQDMFFLKVHNLDMLFDKDCMFQHFATILSILTLGNLVANYMLDRDLRLLFDGLSAALCS